MSGASAGTMAATAAATAAAAAASGTPADDAAAQGKEAAAAAQGAVQPTATPPSPLSQLVKYIPTETIALYIAVQGALGEVTAPDGRQISDANFASRWVWLWVLFGQPSS